MNGPILVDKKAMHQSRRAAILVEDVIYYGQSINRSRSWLWTPRKHAMTRQELLSRISINPDVCFGKPCIHGHRIWVSLILDFLASGMTIQEILAGYPGLEEPDVLACIAYGAEMSRERFVEIPLETKQ
jgi:uncharacterized protein (DUF433 family)